MHAFSMGGFIALSFLSSAIYRAISPKPINKLLLHSPWNGSLPITSLLPTSPSLYFGVDLNLTSTNFFGLSDYYKAGAPHSGAPHCSDAIAINIASNDLCTLRVADLPFQIRPDYIPDAANSADAPPIQHDPVEQSFADNNIYTFFASPVSSNDAVLAAAAAVISDASSIIIDGATAALACTLSGFHSFSWNAAAMLPALSSPSIEQPPPAAFLTAGTGAPSPCSQAQAPEEKWRLLLSRCAENLMQGNTVEPLEQLEQSEEVDLVVVGRCTASESVSVLILCGAEDGIVLKTSQSIVEALSSACSEPELRAIVLEVCAGATHYSFLPTDIGTGIDINSNKWFRNKVVNFFCN